MKLPCLKAVGMLQALEWAFNLSFHKIPQISKSNLAKEDKIFKSYFYFEVVFHLLATT